VVIRGISVAPRAIWAPIVAIQLALNLYFFSNPKNLWNDGDGVAAVCARGGAPFCGLLPSFVDRPQQVGVGTVESPVKFP
jgi:hypothetical protein